MAVYELDTKPPCPNCGEPAVLATVRASPLGILIGEFCCPQDHPWISEWMAAVS